MEIRLAVVLAVLLSIVAACKDTVAPLPSVGAYSISFTWISPNNPSHTNSRTVAIALSYVSSDSVAGTVSGPDVAAGQLLLGRSNGGKYNIAFYAGEFGPTLFIESAFTSDDCTGRAVYGLAEDIQQFTSCTVGAQ